MLSPYSQAIIDIPKSLAWFNVTKIQMPRHYGRPIVPPFIAHMYTKHTYSCVTHHQKSRA